MASLVISAFFLLLALCASFSLYRIIRAVDARYELGLFTSKFAVALLVLGCLGFVAV